MENDSETFPSVQDQLETSSSVQDDLETFRNDWKRELDSKKAVPQQQQQQEEEANEALHAKARAYFLQGVQYEENGKLYDAVKFYKKAVSLVPDIENETFLYTGRTHSSNNKKPEPVDQDEIHTSGASGHGEQDDRENEEGEMDPLLDRFSRIRLQDSKPLVQPEMDTKARHIGELPSEVLNYILKWVVSTELDIRSLEAFSLVCRGFYIAARDNEIWRLICARIWGSSIGGRSLNSVVYRDLFIARPKVRFNGCYVSKMTYIREGERGFQDHENYRAWHVVQYYRFFRFFPGGRLLMTISAEDPGLTAKLMNSRTFCSIQGSLFGEYKVMENTVVCTLFKHKPKKFISRLRKKKMDAAAYYEAPDQDFQIELTMMKGGAALVWNSYKILSTYSNGRQSEDTVSLSDNNFPRMKFFPVGSYHFESNSPLRA